MGWQDIIGDVSSKSGSLSAPQLLPFNGMFRSWFFNAGSRCDITYHIPHDYIMGTDIMLHIHWSHVGELITGDFEIAHFLSIAKGHDQMAFTDEIKIHQIIKCDGIGKKQHRVSEITISGQDHGLLDTSMIEPDTIITNAMVVNKIPNIIGDVCYPTILCADIHYQSSDVSTPNRLPPYN
jgi:hypothetical protein